MNTERQELRDALQSIVDAADKTKAVSWAVNYAKRGVALIDNDAPDYLLEPQCLYTLNNITHW